MLRSAAELADVADPAWPALLNQINHAVPTVRVVPVDSESAEAVLYRLQVTTRSVLGSVAFYCGGILIDHGWLRMLGGSGKDCPASQRQTTCPIQPRQPVRLESWWSHMTFLEVSSL